MQATADPLLKSDAENGSSVVQRHSLSDQAYGLIRKALMTGQLKPGQKISSREMAERLGTSLTPVREALLHLVAEGVLESHTGRSVRVPILTKSDYLELRDLRVEVEGLGAARAATQISPEGIKQLQDIHDRLSRAKAERRFDDALRWNEAFHINVARESRMPRLVRVVESLWAQSGPFLNFLYNDAEPFPETGRPHPHALLIEALQRRDSEAARDAITQDIIRGGESLILRLR
jgi:DNA-binding GntR family transcriptional regulator